MLESKDNGEQSFAGMAASGGVVQGRILRVGLGATQVVPRPIEVDQIETELVRLRHAIAETRRQIHEVQERVLGALGAKEAAIFEAHVLVLEDPTLIEEIARFIREERQGAEYAVQRISGRFCQALEGIHDPYLSERSMDVRDVSQRLIKTLTGEPSLDLSRLEDPVIIIAADLSPSATALLDRSKVLGFATAAGGITSHTAIMARKLRIPAVVGLGELTNRVRSGDHALLDGHGGVLIVNPSDATLYRFGQIRERRAALEVRLSDLREQPAVTLDGARILLAGNIDEPGEVASVREAGADGVGLFRTEFLFLGDAGVPDEEQQYLAYRAAVESLAPNPVVIRTLDLGGDKLPGGGPVRELNPFLGWRAIRISLSEPELFRVQLRAVLRASAHGNLKLMFPMISSLDELLEANRLLEETQTGLAAQGIPFDPDMEVGMMVEVPSAALMAAELAPHVDFFSLGTNDLTQYTLAVDRLNERVAALHAPTHPAVIRLIRLTVEAARAHGCWVGVCGEMAGDPAVIPLLVGLGVDELSASPSLLPSAKFLLRRLKQSEAVAMASQALRRSRACEVLELSRSLAQSVAPELFNAG